MDDEFEVVVVPCCGCGTAIETKWTLRGVLPGDFVLVADWVFHPSCWDMKVRENPP